MNRHDQAWGLNPVFPAGKQDEYECIVVLENGAEAHVRVASTGVLRATWSLDGDVQVGIRNGSIAHAMGAATISACYKYGVIRPAYGRCCSAGVTMDCPCGAATKCRIHGVFHGKH